MRLPPHSDCQVSHKDLPVSKGQIHRLYLLKRAGGRGGWNSGRADGTRKVVVVIITKCNLPQSPKNIWGGGEGLELFYVDRGLELGQVMKKSKMVTDVGPVKGDIVKVLYCLKVE